MITLADLSPFDRRRNRAIELRESHCITRDDYRDELRAIAADERRERQEQKAKRAESASRRGRA